MRRVVYLAVLSAVAGLLLLPGVAAANGTISYVTVEPSSVSGGASAQGTVVLAFPDPEPVTVQLFSSDPSVATVPATVTVPVGATSATFTVATNAAAPSTIVTISAWVDLIRRATNLQVNAATPPGPSLSSVSVSPSTVTGGSPATGTITFSGATDGAVVQLSSSNPALVQVPSEAVVNGGQSTGTFPVTTSAVSATTAVTITAGWFGVTRSTTITLNPGAPAPADRVAIKTATWKRGLLTIEATSTNPNAILSVYSRSGSFMFTLTNKGGGRYYDQRGWVDNPQQITVRSNLGGSATATLKT